MRICNSLNQCYYLLLFCKILTHYKLTENMSFDKIFLDSITTPLDIILTSSSPKIIQGNENVSKNSVCSKSDKSNIAKIENYWKK